MAQTAVRWKFGGLRKCYLGSGTGSSHKELIISRILIATITFCNSTELSGIYIEYFYIDSYNNIVSSADLGYSAE